MTVLLPPTWWLVVALPAVAGFFIGAVNPASIFARLLGKDLSQYSGNPGATNATRVLGRRWGILVGALDVLKGLVPTYAALWAFGVYSAYLVAVAVVLGHLYSPYLRGRGGKGVSTTLGVLLAVHPWYAAALLAVFLIVVGVSRWVALGSLSAAAGLVVVGVIAATGRLPGSWGLPTAVWAITLGSLILLRHRRNIIARIRRRR
jgi:glycerol-3-phosphate acyltransferase PlsY